MALEGPLSSQTSELRAIEARDNPAIAAVIREVMREFNLDHPGGSFFDPEVDDMYGYYAGAGHAFFVAVSQQSVIGGAGIGPLVGGPNGVCELRKMYLLSQARGLGLGRALLDRCLTAARTEGFHSCYIETAPQLAGAQALYLANGFERLPGRMGNTGHNCDLFFSRSLG